MQIIIIIIIKKERSDPSTKPKPYNHGQIHWDSTAFYLSNHFLSHILGSFGPPTPPFNVAWGK